MAAEQPGDLARIDVRGELACGRDEFGPWQQVRNALHEPRAERVPVQPAALQPGLIAEPDTAHEQQAVAQPQGVHVALDGNRFGWTRVRRPRATGEHATRFPRVFGGGGLLAAVVQGSVEFAQQLALHVRLQTLLIFHV